MELTKEPFEDEIDLRQIIRTLFHYKLLIIGLPIIMALTAGLVSRYFLPHQYQATSLVLITKPFLTANFDSQLQSNPQVPDIKTLTDLATSDDLVRKVIQEAEGKQIPVGYRPPSDLVPEMSVTQVGTGQLRLTVTDKNPQRATRIANVWADQLTDQLNQLYGSSQESLNQIEQQMQTSKEAWSKAEQTLLNELPSNQAASLQVQLSQANDMLKVYLNKVGSIDLILDDANFLDSRLSRLDATAPLRIEDSMSMVTLYQRASSDGNNDLQFQITSPNALGETYTVREARASLKAFIQSLEEQRQEQQSKVENLQNRVTSLTKDLEAAQYAKTQLTVQRDLAQTTYQALSNQAEELRIALTQKDQTAKVAGYALTPTKPSGPRTLVNTLIAGVLGLVLASTFVLAWEWWNSPEEPGSSTANQPPVAD
jgi:uncharacterized protein involved in exopolysaccharide biosynthesis